MIRATLRHLRRALPALGLTLVLLGATLPVAAARPTACCSGGAASDAASCCCATGAGAVCPIKPKNKRSHDTHGADQHGARDAGVRHDHPWLAPPRVRCGVDCVLTGAGSQTSEALAGDLLAIAFFLPQTDALSASDVRISPRRGEWPHLPRGPPA